MITFVLFILGLGLLVVGAEVLVKGASRLAGAVGISPLVIGLTVVAFGTSAPEMAVSVTSALSGQAGADIALGNVVGSNIFNVLLILGLAAVISPLVVAQKLVRLEVPLMIAVSVLVFVLALDGVVGRWDGGLLLAGIVAYTVFAVVAGRRESRAMEAEYGEALAARSGGPGRLAANAGFILAGLGMLVLGSDWLVDGAVAIARALGVGELIIALTIVAAGTSMPEVATSVMASVRGERDIAVGNVIGSNLFNLLCVLGLGAVVGPAGINVAASALWFDLPVMIAVAVACLPVFFTGYAIARWEGWLFLLYYAVYTLFLILSATGHAALGTLSAATWGFLLPLTVITLGVAVFRQLRGPARAS
ncbi:calcium/sodium antiporter [Ectothiorhodospiraceae bacterium WFHF3C12]|nr:calcium/sodium antiporter [Ectothiorhodospiraceae bacterium WFHF3C12]